MILVGALANTSREVATDDFLRFLKEEMPDVRFFKISPPPGKMMAAGVDWQAIVNTGASLITFAGVLWKAYQKFIVPLRISRKTSEPGIFLMLENAGGRPAHVLLQKDFQSKKEFTDDIVRVFGDQVADTRSPELTPDPTLWKEIT